jgi:ABC-type bacteriocin/lantibiotic exporter with double-glycine peptidase domain
MAGGHSQNNSLTELTVSVLTDPVAVAVEHAALLVGAPVSPAEIKRACTDVSATASHPLNKTATEDQTRQRMLVQVADRVRMRCGLARLSIHEALPLVSPTKPLLAYSPQFERWVSVEDFSGRHASVVVTGIDTHPRQVLRADLPALLGLPDVHTVYVWVVPEPAHQAADLSMHHEEEHGHGGHDHGPAEGLSEEDDYIRGHAYHASPAAAFRRLLGLLRMERKDIWVVIVFSIWVSILSLAIPITVETLVNTVAFGALVQPVVALAVLLAGCLTFAAILDGLQKWIVEIMTRRIFVRVVSDLAQRLPRVRISAFDTENGPEIMNRYFDIMTIQKSATGLMLEGVAIVLNTFIGLMILGFYHPWLLGFDVVLVACVATIVFGLGRGAVQTSINESVAKYNVAAWLEQLAKFPISFKTGGANEFAYLRTDALTQKFLMLREAHFAILFRQIISTLGLHVVASTALLGLGGALVITGELTLGQLVAANLIVTVVVGSFTKLDKHLAAFYDMQAGLNKVGHMLDLPVERQNGVRPVSTNIPATITARDVGYWYHSHHAVLHGINFELRSGERLGIVGPSGSGKSTLMDIAFGLRDPRAGMILFDDVDIRELHLESMRTQVSMVRGIEILHGSLAENVSLGRPHISPPLIREALLAVGLLNEVLRLPNGIHTQLNIDGNPLSQGQLRRLMLARAIVSQPRLLILDESLDLIDAERLGTVLDTIFDRTAPWSVLVVTHEQAIAERCDRVIALFHNSTVELPRDEKRDLRTWLIAVSADHERNGGNLLGNGNHGSH